MALDDNTRTGRDGQVLPLDLKDGDILLHHGTNPPVRVEFVEYTKEVALPRTGGAVIRYAYPHDGFFGGCTDTAVAGELSLPKGGSDESGD